ncbi:hypothetical protein TCDM_08731 [Trypanosoma cruzi Dm28c]|uniref:Uncharacterized protein n=1 Tax=Trypanosoma cruzi Dm28c TaxID=1416333 RepID=V5BBN3_TRYCR|nr:hypothetical protein TCDM_08731 [Trypanosoma cruzi Dm28c]
MRIRLLFALSGLSGSNGHRRFGVAQTRTGDRSGAKRSVHGFWQALPRTFRTLIAITTDPSISRPPHFVPAFTCPFTRLTPLRGQPSLLWSGAQPNKNNDCCDVSCVVFMDTTHLHATCAAQPEELLAAQSAIKNGEGLPTAYEGGRIQPHPFHHHPPIRTQDVAPCRRRSIRYFELPEPIVGKGNGAYPQINSPWHDEPPTPTLWTSYMRGANEAAREMCAPSTWEQRMSLAWQFTTFCCTHERPINAGSRAAFLAAIVCVAPLTRRQHTRMLRSMLQID